MVSSRDLSFQAFGNRKLIGVYIQICEKGISFLPTFSPVYRIHVMIDVQQNIFGGLMGFPLLKFLHHHRYVDDANSFKDKVDAQMRWFGNV